MKTTFAVVGMFLALGFSLILTGVAGADDDGSADPGGDDESDPGDDSPGSDVITVSGSVIDPITQMGVAQAVVTLMNFADGLPFDPPIATTSSATGAYSLQFDAALGLGAVGLRARQTGYLDGYIYHLDLFGLQTDIAGMNLVLYPTALMEELGTELAIDVDLSRGVVDGGAVWQDANGNLVSLGCAQVTTNPFDDAPPTEIVFYLNDNGGPTSMRDGINPMNGEFMIFNVDAGLTGISATVGNSTAATTTWIYPSGLTYSVILDHDAANPVPSNCLADDDDDASPTDDDATPILIAGQAVDQITGIPVADATFELLDASTGASLDPPVISTPDNVQPFALQIPAGLGLGDVAIKGSRPGYYDSYAFHMDIFGPDTPTSALRLWLFPVALMDELTGLMGVTLDSTKGMIFGSADWIHNNVASAVGCAEVATDPFNAGTPTEAVYYLSDNNRPSVEPTSTGSGNGGFLIFNADPGATTLSAATVSATVSAATFVYANSVTIDVLGFGGDAAPSAACPLDLTGSVIDGSTGNPAVGATVTVLDPNTGLPYDPPMTATAGADGTINLIVPDTLGLAGLQVSLTGYLSSYYWGPVDNIVSAMGPLNILPTDVIDGAEESFGVTPDPTKAVVVGIANWATYGSPQPPFVGCAQVTAQAGGDTGPTGTTVYFDGQGNPAAGRTGTNPGDGEFVIFNTDASANSATPATITAQIGSASFSTSVPYLFANGVTYLIVMAAPPGFASNPTPANCDDDDDTSPDDDDDDDDDTVGGDDDDDNDSVPIDDDTSPDDDTWLDDDSISSVAVMQCQQAIMQVYDTCDQTLFGLAFGAALVSCDQQDATHPWACILSCLTNGHDCATWNSCLSETCSVTADTPTGEESENITVDGQVSTVSPFVVTTTVTTANNSITIHYDGSQIQPTFTTQSNGHVLVGVSNAGMSAVLRRGMPGEPSLPIFNIKAILPPDTDPNSVTVTAPDIGYQSTGVTVENIQTGLVDLAHLNDPVGAIFNTPVTQAQIAPAGVYPASPFRLEGVEVMRKWVYADCSFYPYGYNFAQQTLVATEPFTVTFNFQRIGGPSVRLLSGDTLFDDTASHFANYDVMASVYHVNPLDPPFKWGTLAIVTRNVLAYDAAGRFNDDTHIFDYAMWGGNAGFPTIVVTESDYNPTGNPNNRLDLMAKTWLASHYQSFGIGYVLLIGDPREAYVSNTGQCPDLSWLKIGGSWTGDSCQTWDVDRNLTLPSRLVDDYERQAGTCSGLITDSPRCEGQPQNYQTGAWGVTSYSDKWYSDMYTYPTANPGAYWWDPNNDGTAGEYCGDWVQQDGWQPAYLYKADQDANPGAPWSMAWSFQHRWPSMPSCPGGSNAPLRPDRPHLVPSFFVGRLPVYVNDKAHQQMLGSVLANYRWLNLYTNPGDGWWKKMLGFSTIMNTFADQDADCSNEKADSSVNMDILESFVMAGTGFEFLPYNINERGNVPDTGHAGNSVDDDAGYQVIPESCHEPPYNMPYYQHVYCEDLGDEGIGDNNKRPIDRLRDADADTDVGLMIIFAEGPDYWEDARTIWIANGETVPQHTEITWGDHLFQSEDIMQTDPYELGHRRITFLGSCNGGRWAHTAGASPEFNLAEAFIYGGISSTVIANSNVFMLGGLGDGTGYGMQDLAASFALSVTVQDDPVGVAYFSACSINGPPSSGGEYHNILCSNLFGDPRLTISGNLGMN
jgi:hypothetical protein